MEWLVLDRQMLVFQEADQKLFGLHGSGAVLWEALWGDCGDRRPVSREQVRSAVAKLARSGCSSRASEIRACADTFLAEWHGAGLITSAAGMTAAPPTPLTSSGAVARLRLKKHRASHVVAGCPVSIEAPASLSASIGRVFGHLEGTQDLSTDIRLILRPGHTGYLAEAPDGETVTLATPSEVVVWLKVALLEAILARDPGLVAFHAAGVELDGGLVLLAGRSGAGKSTLAAALNATGCPLVGEDVVLFHAGSALFGGMALSFAAKTGSWTALDPYFADIGRLPVHVRPDGKSVKYLTPVRFGGDVHEHLRAIVVPHFEPGAVTELAPLCRVSTLIDLLDEARNAHYHLSGPAFRALARAVAKANTFRLTYSSLAAALPLLKAASATGVGSGTRPAGE